MKNFIGILLAYVMAAPLTSTISFNLEMTEWTNLWTYIWWASGWLFWVVIIVVLGTIFGERR